MALGGLVSLRGISFERASEFVRLALGCYPHDPVRPHRLLVPSGERRWLPRWHGPKLARLTRDADWVFLTRTDQAALLPSLEGRRLAYYAIDDYRHYSHYRSDDERAVVAASAAVFVCSEALAERFARDFPGVEARLTVLPMGISARHVPASCPTAPAPVPGNATAGRPLFGILGAIGERLRFEWILHCVEALPWSHWLWVGHFERGALSQGQADALRRLRRHPRCIFTGRRDHDAMPAYAASLDAAVIPYTADNINPCSSPMRCFLQLPFGTPLVATPGCRALDALAPLVRLCPTAEAMAAALAELRAQHFDDGLREQRWRLAQQSTWEVRATATLQALRRADPHRRCAATDDVGLRQTQP